MTELRNDQSKFAKALNEAMGLGEKARGISFNVLLAMHEMETTFDLTWIEKYFRNDGKNRMVMLNAALSELLSDWADLVDTASQSVKEIRAIRNEQRRQTITQEKEEAQARVKAAQNLVRDCVSALVYFRNTEIVSMKVNNSKRLELSTKDGIRYSKATALTFKDVVGFGNDKATELKWTVAKPETSTPKVEATKGTSVAETIATVEKVGTSFPDGFVTVCNALRDLLNVKDLASASDAEQAALRELEHAIIRKTYADSKGIVDVEMLSAIYAPEEKAPLVVVKKSRKGAK